MKQYRFSQLKNFIASSESMTDEVVYTLQEHNSVMCQLAETKDKLHRRNLLIDNLRREYVSQIMYIGELKRKNAYLEDFVFCDDKRIKEYQSYKSQKAVQHFTK